jgi:FAD/FMN-containing dehydrogenase
VDLTAFAEEVGTDGPVTITGRSSRGGPVPGVRCVAPPAGIEWLATAEMTVRCGAGTPVEQLSSALAETGQRVALPVGGSVGGALATGRSGIFRLGHGPLRDALLQATVVTAEGRIVKAGGPTVKNVSGFDLCRLLVGSQGTLAFIGDVILRTWPAPAVRRWFRTPGDPWEARSRLYRPVSVLWDGQLTWVCLEGEATDVAEQARLLVDAQEVDGPPQLPPGGRLSVPPAALRSLGRPPGTFVAEIGVGVVYVDAPVAPAPVDDVVADLNRRVKAAFDPTGRLNPGRSPLTA